MLFPDDWTDYELVDSGDGMKLERFGLYYLARPDPRAIWSRRIHADVWGKASARYLRTSNTEGHWDIITPPPSNWNITYRDMTFRLETTAFKHLGIFPEQAVNWMWLQRMIAGRPLSVLNLFAYTGAATVAAAKAGARVTHLDSVKSTISRAQENAQLNQIPSDRIRWIEDDAMKFITREVKRGNVYDGIILDPPRFGRGSKGEVWKLLDDLPRLLMTSADLLYPHASFLLVNAYTADISALALGNLVTSALNHRGGTVTCGELCLKESGDAGRFLPSGILARWSR